MIRVLIADLYTILNIGLSHYIEKESDLKVVGCTSDENELIFLCNNILPDVLLMDIGVCKRGGVKTIERIKEINKNLKILILTSSNDENTIFQALDSDIDGYLFKDIGEKTITTAIRCVYSGIQVLHKTILNLILKRDKQNKIKYDEYSSCYKGHFNITELKILNGIINGKSNHDIARDVYLSKGSVANIITRIFEKTNLSDRTQLAVYAVKNNIV